MKTYKFRMYPEKREIGKLENTLSMCRHLYNWSLAERITAYQIRRYSNSVEISIKPGKTKILSTCFGQIFYPETKESVAVKALITIEGMFGITFSAFWENVPRNITCYDQNKKLPGMKEVKPWYKSVYSQVLQNVIERLDGAYEKFFEGLKEGKKKAGFPKFKKRGKYSSITYPQYKFRPENGKIRIPKIGNVKIVYHREIPKRAIIKTLTIKKDGGKWFACFSVEMPKKVKPEHKQDLAKSIGLDAGLIDFYYGSDGSHVPVPKYFRKREKQLARLQRKFQRLRDEYKGKGKPSAYYKTLKALQKVHYRIRCQREDFHHKQANRLLLEFDIIIHEDLNIQGMKRRPKPKQDEEGKYLPNRAAQKVGLNKSISDVAWGKFFQILNYKALAMGKEVIPIDPKYTSQICSGCGKTVEKTLSMRTHICPFCGLILPRDYNSALYIRDLGLEKKRAGIKTKTKAKSAIPGDYVSVANTVKDSGRSTLRQAVVR